MDAKAGPPPSHWPSPRLVYVRHYNIAFAGLERLHPFDSRKYGRAWKLLRRRFGSRLRPFTVKPPRQIRHAELLAVHTPEYLRRLREPRFLAGILEIPLLRYLPGWLTDWRVLRP